MTYYNRDEPIQPVSANSMHIILHTDIDSDALAEAIRKEMSGKQAMIVNSPPAKFVKGLVQQVYEIAHNAYSTGRDDPLTERLGALEDALDEIITLCEQQMEVKQ